MSITASIGKVLDPIGLTSLGKTPGASVGDNLARLLDPAGLTKASRIAGGGLKNVWDPAGVFTGNKGTGTAAAAAPAIAPAAAPITSASPEVLQTQEDYRRMMAKKRGFSSAIFAGDTGGWFGANPTPSPMSPKTGTTSGATRLGSGTG